MVVLKKIIVTIFILLIILIVNTPSAIEDKSNIIIEGEVNAPVEEVWKAFTTKEGIESWMAPAADIDLHIGGAMRTNYNPNGKLGDSSTITNTILSYDPLRMLSIKATGVPEDFPFKKAIKNMWSVIYFEVLPNNHTLVRVISLGYSEESESQKLREFFKKGNAYTMEKLQKRFAK